jgi:alpha-glucosidase
MTAALHAAGIRVIVDIVPNHTSNRHPWFVEALAAAPGSPARDRYLFRDGSGAGGGEPPADWKSVFGGPAWEPVGDGQWYFHHYAAEQPDLNWKNPDVREDFLRTLRFWADRGVDGFRIDVAHGLAKDIPATGPLPTAAVLDAMPRDGQHLLWDRDEVHDIYAGWRTVLDQYEPPRAAIAEAWVPAERRWRYASATGLGQAFNFDLLMADFDAAQFRQIIATNLQLAARTGSSSTWVLSNHDVIRPATRYMFAANQGSLAAGQAWLAQGGPMQGLDPAIGLRRAVAASMLTLALPGSTYLYQGEELGLLEVTDIPPACRQDPVFLRTAGAWPGRDGCRVPLPWSGEEPAFGFGASGAHLPQPPWFQRSAVDAQLADTGSTLQLYRKALRLRREMRPGVGFEWIATDRADVLAFRRSNGWVSITNFGAEPWTGIRGRLLASSSPCNGTQVPGATTVWLLT